ncbi:MAG: 3-deoxy-8-phosphooctulonate synthase, partial [Rhizobiales bacterium]|nr:3-deoxy-8-phosphooctulonate synthase [Hyphomicrobiales bacterium]
MQMKLDKWNIAIGDGAPLVVMAGLNVLEDKALALEVCAELKSICADLGLPYIFKASFDKANRSSVSSYRGPGEADGLAMLTKLKAKHNVPIVTDLHTPAQA